MTLKIIYHSFLLKINKEVIMKDVIMYTDGACSGNPGVGGYGIVLISTDLNFSQGRM